MKHTVKLIVYDGLISLRYTLYNVFLHKARIIEVYNFSWANFFFEIVQKTFKILISQFACFIGTFIAWIDSTVHKDIELTFCMHICLRFKRIVRYVE